MTDGIEIAHDLHARRTARHDDHRQRFTRGCVRIRPAHHRQQMRALAVPAAAIGGVVFLAGDDPFVAVEAREGLHARLRIGAVEIRAAGHFGEGERGQSVGRLRKNLTEPGAFLILAAKADDRLQAEAGGEQGGRHIDIDRRQLLGGQGEVEGRKSRAAKRLWDQCMHEALLGHARIERAGRKKAICGRGDGRDGLPDLA